MRVLAIDTASAACSIALVEHDAIICQHSEQMVRGQDSALLPLVEQSLEKAQWSIETLDKIVAVRGPGSFTGIRVGLAAAQGLAVGLGKPLYGLDRFMIYRAMLPQENLLLLFDSRREEIFCQYQNQAGVASEPFIATQAELQRYDAGTNYYAGDFQPAFTLAKQCSLPHSEAACAALLAAKLTHTAPYEAVPLYLRAPDVSHGPAPERE